MLWYVGFRWDSDAYWLHLYACTSNSKMTDSVSVYVYIQQTMYPHIYCCIYSICMDTDWQQVSVYCCNNLYMLRLSKDYIKICYLLLYFEEFHFNLSSTIMQNISRDVILLSIIRQKHPKHLWMQWNLHSSAFWMWILAQKNAG